jgi:hypothetical protein
MVNLRSTLSANTQFLAGLRDVRRENLSRAIALRCKVETRQRRLERVPESGRRIPEGEVIRVVAVWHGAQVPDEP